MACVEVFLTPTLLTFWKLQSWLPSQLRGDVALAYSSRDPILSVLLTDTPQSPTWLSSVAAPPLVFMSSHGVFHQIENRDNLLYLLRSPQHHQSLSYSCLNVNEQTKFAESEGWKVEEFEWKLWTAKTGSNLALNFVLRTAVRKPQTSKMPAMGDLCLNISQLDLLHQGLPAPTRCSTCSWLAFVSLWQFQIHIQTPSHLCYCTHQKCPLVSVPPSTPKPPPPWSLPWLHFMPDRSFDPSFCHLLLPRSNLFQFW